MKILYLSQHLLFIQTILMKHLFLIFSILFSTSLFTQAQEVPPKVPRDSTNAFLNAHYGGGTRGFLENVYKNINYPLASRNNCNSGILIAKLTFGQNGQITNLTFYNPLDDDLEEEVTRIINLTAKGWKSSVAGKSFIISFSFLVGVREKLDGYINVTAEVLNSDGCETTKQLQRKLNRAVKKEKYEKALTYCIEILRRNPWSEEHIKLYKELMKR